MNRVKALEGQITELEAEASRLLRALDQMKEAKFEVERSYKRKEEEAAREASSQAAEIESLKEKVKQYSDHESR